MYKYYRFLLCFLTLISSLVYGNDKPNYKIATLSNDFVSNIIFDYLSEDLNMNFEYINFDNFGDALEAVRDSHVDFMANVTYTEERGVWLEFSEPTNSEFIYLYTIKDNIALSKAQTFGVMSHSIYTELLPTSFPNANFVEYHDLDAAKQLLMDDKVDGIVGDTSYLQPMIGSGFKVSSIKRHYSSHPVSLIAPKGKYLDILSLMQERLLTLDFQQYLKAEVEQYQIALRTQQLRKDIIKSNFNIYKTLNITLEVETSFSNNHEHHGAMNELVNDVCRILQLKCKISFKDKDWKQGNYKFRSSSNKIDIIAPVTINEKIQEQFYFSNSFYQQQAVFVKRIGYKSNMFDYFAELFNEKIGVVGNSYNEERLRLMFPDKKIIPFHSNQDLVNGLLDGTVDYAYMNRSAFNLAQVSSKKVLSIELDTRLGVINKYDLVFAFPKSDDGKVLSEVFSGAIALVDMNKIIEKYDVPIDWYEKLEWKRTFRHVGYLGFFAIFLLLISAMFFFYYKSLTDDLTKLRNRLALYKKYGKSFNYSYSVVYLDVNKFKFINDNFGHDAGDNVLKLISDRIRTYWMGQGYRIGGDEFVLIYKGNPDSINEMLKQIRNISIVLDSEQESHEVTLSVGIVKPRERNMTMDEVLLEADERMYRSKEKFRASVR